MLFVDFSTPFFMASSCCSFININGHGFRTKTRSGMIGMCHDLHQRMDKPAM
jgi:hypothetical protein